MDQFVEPRKAEKDNQGARIAIYELDLFEVLIQ